METNKTTYTQIEQYFQGKLNAKAMHQLERKALEDPFLADALEGYSHIDGADSHLSILQRQLKNRIALQEEKKNVFFFSWQRISVAAAASLLFISASILFWMKGSRQDVALVNNEKKVDVILANPDSLLRKANKNSDGPTVLNRASKPDIKPKKVPDRPKSTFMEKEVMIASRRNATLPDTLNKIVAAYSSKKKENPISILSSNDSIANLPSEVSDIDVNLQSQKSKRVNDTQVVNSSLSPSEPLIGWNEYKRYLRENRKNPESLVRDSKVLLRFSVNEQGTPVNIKVTEGVSKAFDKEAIRLIEQGPKWKPSSFETQIAIEFKK